MIGVAIRLGTMFVRNRDVREVGFRAANVGSSYGGGGTGNLVFQAADFAISRLITANGGNGGSVTVPSPIIFGGA